MVADASKRAKVSPSAPPAAVPEIVAENDALEAPAKNELERRGHKVRTTDGLGEVAAVRVVEGGRLEAAADDRRDPGGAGVLNP